MVSFLTLSFYALISEYNEILNCLNFNKKLEELRCSKIFELKHMHSVD